MTLITKGSQDMTKVQQMIVIVTTATLKIKGNQLTKIPLLLISLCIWFMTKNYSNCLNLIQFYITAE